MILTKAALLLLVVEMEGVIVDAPLQVSNPCETVIRLDGSKFRVFYPSAETVRDV